MSLLDSMQTDEQKLLIKIGKDIGEPVTIKILDYYLDERKIRFEFPDNWKIMMDFPIEKEYDYDTFIFMVKHIRADQLKDVENTA